MRRLDVAEAAALLRGGALVAFPTETVYGLGADATDPAAIAALYAAKGRPARNPLIVHLPDAAAALAEVAGDGRASTLAARFWPGPLTLVLRRAAASRIVPAAAAGGDTLAVRVPAQPLALALLRAVARPVAAPSANRSGRVSPTTAAHVEAELEGRIAGVLDGGPCAIGLESTVIDLIGPRPVLLRPGGVPRAALEAVIGPVADPAAMDGPLRSPGLLASHYAPALPVRLAATAVGAGEALLAFGAPLPGAALTWNLSLRGDLDEAARKLFAGLRWLDEAGARAGLRGIAAQPIPGHGLGAAINDRLARAAAPRS